MVNGFYYKLKLKFRLFFSSKSNCKIIKFFISLYNSILYYLEFSEVGKVFLSRLKNPFVAASFLCAVFIYTGVFHIKERHPFLSVFYPEEIIFMEGTVSSNPVISSSGKYYFCNLKVSNVTSETNGFLCSSTASGRIKLAIPSKIVEALYPGKLFSVSDGVILIENGEKIGVEGKWKADKQIYYVESAEYFGHGSTLIGKIMHRRNILRLNFKRLMFSWKNAGGLILSLLSGSREYLEDGISERFKNAGLSHILALSGMHLSFFSGISGTLAIKMFGKKFSLFFRFMGILIFVIFAGLSPSLLRTLICSVLVLLCELFFCGKTDFFIILCLSFIIHCVISPADLFSSAFLLSYSALCGIMLFGDFINSVLIVIVPSKISSSLSASLAAQLSTAGISIGLFGKLIPVGILSSAVISPMISMFLTLSLAGIFLSFFIPFFSEPFGFILNFVYNRVTDFVSFFALFPSIKF